MQSHDAPPLLATLKRYIGFDDRTAEQLAEIRTLFLPHIPGVIDHFYEVLSGFEDAVAVITGGLAQIDRLKLTLTDWVETGLAGPHDEAFLERRSRIGWVHVRIGLPQHYMVTAMNVMRIDLRQLADKVIEDADHRRRLADALDKWYDLELAIMLDAYRRASDERLRRRQRLATIGQLAATIAHDLRNPISVAQSSAYILRRRTAKGDERALRHLDRIELQLTRSNAIISDLLEVVRDRPPDRAPVNLCALIHSVIEDITHPDSTSIHVDADLEGPIAADEGLLRQALVNLVSNAVDSLAERGGNVWVRAYRDGAETIGLTVEDDGTGFPQEVLDNAFEPLVTTRAKGTGLGLPLVENVVRRHGGRVELGNRPSGGASVRMYLPAPEADHT